MSQIGIERERIGVSVSALAFMCLNALPHGVKSLPPLWGGANQDLKIEHTNAVVHLSPKVMSVKSRAAFSFEFWRDFVAILQNLASPIKWPDDDVPFWLKNRNVCAFVEQRQEAFEKIKTAVDRVESA